MEKQLLNLEKSFFRYECVSDRQWLSDILHDDFLECGKSGFLFTKADTVEALLSCEKDRDIEILHFQWAQLADSCFHQASGLSEKMFEKV